jgi:ribosomal protein S12 methylthiotransferase accessory factor
MTGVVTLKGMPDLVAAELDIKVREDAHADWPLFLSRHSSVATIAAGAEQIEGIGCALTEEDARRRAVMECLERHAQFGCTTPLTRAATGASLGATVLSPKSLGLYGDNQYDNPCFQFARYSEQDVLEWVDLIEVSTGQRRWLPVEFVYPRARIKRKPLVAGTSSGTAAHSSRTPALLAAICELVERDSLMMFWHRQPTTNVLPIDLADSSAAASDLDSIRAMGYVVVACLLEYDLGIPCVLALALRGDRFCYGAGCHPCLSNALEHAVCELGGLLRWQLLESKGTRCFLPLAEVKKPQDHYSLYDGGPFHDLLRQILKQTLAAPTQRNQEISRTLSDDGALGTVVNALTVRGYSIYACDLTPKPMRTWGLSVMCAFVPGLIPLYFGYDRLRLGCQRLWSRKGPGRLCNLLPHFMT